jgi:hypothetical protein
MRPRRKNSSDMNIGKAGFSARDSVLAERPRCKDSAGCSSAAGELRYFLC